MVLAYSTGNFADTGAPSLTSPQARVFNSSESEVARASSAVSPNVETRRVETRRPVESTAQTQGASTQRRGLSSQVQAELNRSRDISFAQRGSGRNVERLSQQLAQQQVQERRQADRAEQPSPAEREAQVIQQEQARSEAREERRSNAFGDGQSFARLEAQRAYLDRVDAQRAYRKAAEHEIQVRGERARAAAA